MDTNKLVDSLIERFQIISLFTRHWEMLSYNKGCFRFIKDDLKKAIARHLKESWSTEQEVKIIRKIRARTQVKTLSEAVNKYAS